MSLPPLLSRGAAVGSSTHSARTQLCLPSALGAAFGCTAGLQGSGTRGCSVHRVGPSAQRQEVMSPRALRNLNRKEVMCPSCTPELYASLGKDLRILPCRAHTLHCCLAGAGMTHHIACAPHAFNGPVHGLPCDTARAPAQGPAAETHQGTSHRDLPGNQPREPAWGPATGTCLGTSPGEPRSVPCLVKGGKQLLS